MMITDILKMDQAILTTVSTQGYSVTGIML